MAESQKPVITGKVEMYQELDAQLKSLLGDERDFTANSANTSSVIYNTLPDLDKSPTRQSRRVFCPGRTNMYLCHSFDTWRRNNACSSSLLTQYLGCTQENRLLGESGTREECLKWCDSRRYPLVFAGSGKEKPC
jgi:hypothetical protein